MIIPVRMEPERKRVKVGCARRSRAPYASVACDACHGRKVRCSGDQPCSRCQKQDIHCSYPTAAAASTPLSYLVGREPWGGRPNEPEGPMPVVQTAPGTHQHGPWTNPGAAGLPEDILDSIETLQRQLDDFKAQHLPSPGPVHAQPRTGTTATRPWPADQTFVLDTSADTLDGYAGPTSAAWSMSTADTKLSSLAKCHEPDEPGGARQGQHQPIPVLSHHTWPQPVQHAPAGEQLDHFSVDDVSTCLDTFQNVFGVLHPLAHLDKLRQHSSSLLRIVKRSLTSQPAEAGQCGLLEIFKIVLATALAATAGRQTSLSSALYRSLEPVLSAAFISHFISHDFRTLLLLVAIYHLGNDDLILSTRTIMLAVRTAVEEGLYRHDTLRSKVPDHDKRQAIIRQLWSLFALDRQFNFAAGLPCLLNMDDIDLPSPVGSPYLAAMIDYVQFGTNAWNSIGVQSATANAPGGGPSQESLKYFHYQLHRWHQDLDPTVQFDAAAIESDPNNFFTSAKADGDGKEGGGEESVEVALYLKTLLYLRSNQIQILVLRPLLVDSYVARNHPALTGNAIDIARRSLQTLDAMSTKTALYTSRHAILNHFLSSAMTVLFLAITHEVEKKQAGEQTAQAPDARHSLVELANWIQEGFAIIDRHRSASHSSAKLWVIFERPRHQLIRLGLLAASRASPPDNDRDRERDRGDNSAATAASTGEVTVRRDGDDRSVIDDERPLADLDLGFNFDNLVNWDPLHDGLLGPDWSEVISTDPSGSFGLPSWM